jgi:hypothetical protein
VSEFVRASRLYDVEAGEPLDFDWGKMQPLAESQAEVEQAVATIEERR